jgi:hypothetical protein
MHKGKTKSFTFTKKITDILAVYIPHAPQTAMWGANYHQDISSVAHLQEQASIHCLPKIHKFQKVCHSIKQSQNSHKLHK